VSTWLTFAGAGIGGGLILVVMGLVRPHVSLEQAISRFDTVEVAAPAEKDPTDARTTGLAEVLDSFGRRIGHPVVRNEDLAITGKDRAQFLTLVALSGVGAGLAGASLAALGGSILPFHGFVFVCGLSLVSLLVGSWLPCRSLREKAAVEREHFLRAFGCWLELVALAQAGGMGIEGALRASYSICDDPSFRRLAAALEHAGLAASTPWDALQQLGEELGLQPLQELAATLALAGTEGARVRSSLLAKAESLRQRAISEAEAKANSTTERLFLPSIILMFAFLIFLMFPAGMRLAGLM
jgi:tight adherence protein C